MKDIIRLSIFSIGIAGLMAAACLMPSKTTELPISPTPEEISWVEFCKARHYDPHTENEDIINEFLDTWIGSADEEKMFNNLPAMEV